MSFSFQKCLSYFLDPVVFPPYIFLLQCHFDEVLLELFFFVAANLILLVKTNDWV